MKRFWLVLLSLGLVMAFSASAFAVDVNVSGEYFVGGLYLNKISVNDNNQVNVGTPSSPINVSANPSTAFFYQRLRVETDFIVSPGLKFITRINALERVWGGARNTPGTTLNSDSAGTRAEDENFAFDWAYIDYTSPIGTFDVGYMQTSDTGTIFNNSTTPGGRIKYTTIPFGPLTFNAKITKTADNSYSYNNIVSYTNADKTQYAIEGKYKWKYGLAGMQIQYNDYANTEPTSNYASKYTQFNPYVIAKIGPVDIQAEIAYAVGTLKEYDSGSTSTDVQLSNLAAFLDVTANFAPIYVGGTVAYVSGDDPNTKDRQEGGTVTGGNDFNPCLILFSYYDLTYWVGTINGYGNSTTGVTSVVDGPMTNAWFGQGRIGFKPISDLDVKLSLSYAQADKKPAGFTGGTYGTEVDVTGTYKITNNLSYMLGFGYLFTGDYFKGTSGTNKVDDDYLLINKLTLTF